MPNKRLARVLAFSLLELMIAALVLVVLLLALSSSLQTSFLMDALAKEKTAALFRATSQMEDVLATPWDDLGSKNNQTFDVPLEGTSTTTFLVPGGGRAQPGLVSVQAGGQADLISVEVSVLWQSRALGQEIQVVLRSLVAKH